METEWLVSSFDEASTAYTCSGVSSTLVSANFIVNPILIPRNAHTAHENTINGSKWRLAMETEIEGKLEFIHATVSNIDEPIVDAATDTEIKPEIVARSKRRLVIDTIIEGNIKATHATMSNIYEPTVDAITVTEIEPEIVAYFNVVSTIYEPTVDGVTNTEIEPKIVAYSNVDGFLWGSTHALLGV